MQNINIGLTEDMSIICSLLEHEDIFSSISKEDVSAMEKIGLRNLLEETKDYFYFFLVKEKEQPKGFMSFYRGEDGAYAHTGFLKDFRGSKVLNAWKFVIDIMFMYSEYQKIIAEIPINNHSATNLALKLGFKIDSSDKNTIKLSLNKGV